mgnify:CR=1 FL=1
MLGQPFKWAPQQVFGLPDWDLILRAFVDGGYAVPHDKLSYENSETMLSTGVGVELLLKRNVSVRADWGIALDETPGSERGDNELHFVATLLY